MSFHLLVGPPGSGKTTRLLEQAHEAMARGERVWWVGLPSQRAYIYRRATEAGAVLGLEFLSSQQVYYRLLAHALRLRPLLVGTGRLALVGEALGQVRGELPSPGEARLFTRAIAEAKRFGLSWRDIPSEDEEMRRFGAVFRAYEEVKGERWDYDDFRSETLAFLEEGDAEPEADLIIVDGFRELSPLELAVYRALAASRELWLALPETPPGETPTETLPPASRTQVRSYRVANPVSEARWVLRALKRDLARGADPLELAVVLPESEVKAFSALADEYGVPLMDETPRALADTLAGRLLLDLLELPDYPTASKLLAIPELAPLAHAALDCGVAGREALSALAEELELKQSWQAWLSRLEAPEGELAWARDLLDSLPEIGERSGDWPDWPEMRGHMLERAKEAAVLAKGAHFRAWWAALLQETFMFDRPRGGVALLTAKLVSGRRFGRVYLLRAVEGAYSVGESEDYFVPEELRRPLEETFRRHGLPRRFLGRDRLLMRELLTRGDELTVTYPEADQGGPLVAEPALVGTPPDGKRHAILPDIGAGSRLELAGGASYQAPRGNVNLGQVLVQRLARYDSCAFRYWAERRTSSEGERPWWLALVGDLRDMKRLNAARLVSLKGRYREAAHWLHEREEELLPLTFGVTLPEGGSGPRAYIDAAGRSGSEVRLYRFVEPGRFGDAGEAASYINGRWNELWAAGHMLQAYGGRVKCVRVLVWPVLGAPIEVYDGGISYLWRRIESRRAKVNAAYHRFCRGDTTPSPGFGCRTCGVFDVCREGTR